ncbi:alpha/beta hydrolase [Cognatishimia sp. D5M38]|uniref:Alpha/beta hydrolase n=1 Tax=Cognatishimia coralii TaxID=3083254 RepID=A0ABU8QB52_9RHOB
MTKTTTRRGFLTATSGLAAGAAFGFPQITLASSAPAAAEITASTLDLVDPQYREFAQSMAGFVPDSNSLAVLRQALENGPRQGTQNPTLEHFEMPGSTASFNLFRPETPRATPAPAIIYIHGGGYVFGTAEQYDGYCYDLAQTSGAVVLNVEYRLAPETPFPGPVEDCYDVLTYAYQNAASLGIDPTRISIMGHSAGGGLCASLAILARDRGEVPVKAQFPIYPMLDYRTATTEAPVNNLTTGEFIWVRAANRFGWDSLRGDYAIDDNRIGHFSPTHAVSHEGLPPCFMAVGNLDLFLEEDTAYAMTLTRARVPCEFHIYPGAVHAFDGFPGTNLTTQFARDLAAAFDRLL